MALTQDDFRKLLKKNTEDRTLSKYQSQSNEEGPTFGGKRNLTEEDLKLVKQSMQKKKKKHKKDESYDRDGKKEEEDYERAQEFSEKKAYRDRAAERRKGVNPDYNDGLIKLDHVDIETSKLLGGDLEHTHLVKGLDYALLARAREEERTKEENKNDEPSVTKSSTTQKPNVSLEPKFGSNRAKLIHYYGCGGINKLRVTDRFLQGRTLYEYDILSDDLDAIPTVIKKSKAECKQKYGYVDGKVSEKLLSLMKDISGNHGFQKRRRRKKDKVEQKEDMQVVEEKTNPEEKKPDFIEEEDIFPDAGEYVAPGIENSSSMSVNSQKVPITGGYFSNLSATTTEAANMEAKQKEQEVSDRTEQINYLRKKFVDNVNNSIEDPIARIQKKIQASTTDVYSECFPEYLTSNGSAFDNDDESGKDKGSSIEAKEIQGDKKKTQKLGSDLKKIDKV